MATKFLVEVPHEATMVACLQAIEAFLKTGSHFIRQADWGCKDGEHKAWLIVEVQDRDEARAILPPAFRSQARIVQLNSFSLEDLDGMRRQHGL